MESKVSGHWTDDRLIAHLYGVEAEDAHLASCQECRARQTAMQANRRALDMASSENLGFDFLAAQRRAVYARLTDPKSHWFYPQVRRWTSAAAALFVLGGGVLIYQQNRPQPAPPTTISDAQLAQQVDNLAQDSEPQATAPLQALFEE